MKNDILKEFKTKTTQNGLRVFLVTILLLVGLILVNLLAGLLPKSVTELDISATKMYSVSDSTKRALSKLTDKVDIYLLSSGGEGALSDESLHVKTFLDKYPDYNANIHFEVIDTALDSTFATRLGIQEETSNLDIVVKSDKRFRILSLTDLFYFYIDGIGKLTASEAQQYQYMMAMYGQNVTPIEYFDGENQILTAVDYVTTDILPKIYLLDAHKEAAIGKTLAAEFTANNLETDTLTLLKTGSVPEDCNLLIINYPQTDLTSVETEAIRAYLEKGGKLLLVTAPGVSEMPNLLSVMSVYGLSAEDGIVLEGDSAHYYQRPNFLFPSVVSHSVTSQYMSSKYTLLPASHGIKIAETLPDGVNAKGIFVTTESSYIIPLDAENANLPEGQTTASHNIGAVAESSSGTQLVWISSAGFTDENVNSYSAGGNFAYLLSAIRWMCKENSPLQIAPLPMITQRLIVPSSSAGAWAILLIFVIPIAVFVGGLCYRLHRRKR